jgi:hypothetical protein
VQLASLRGRPVVLAMFFVPVKIVLRNLFAVKYLVSFPDFNFNI